MESMLAVLLNAAADFLAPFFCWQLKNNTMQDRNIVFKITFIVIFRNYCCYS
jgi:hypothetical protein